jgi:hypothetical protein
MTAASAIPLLDLLRASAARGGNRAKKQLSDIAARLVASAMDDYRHVDGLDRGMASEDPQAFDRDAAVVIRRLYDEWASQAETLLDRVLPLERSGVSIAGASELADAVGRTRAMLSVSLDNLDRAEDQLRRGEVKSVEEVRRELRAKFSRLKLSRG